MDCGVDESSYPIAPCRGGSRPGLKKHCCACDQLVAAMKVVVRVTGEGLMPVDRHQSGLLEQFKLGEVITIRITKDRNPQFHRLFFAMLAETFDMQDEYQNKEQWRHAVTVGAGWCDFIIWMGLRSRFPGQLLLTI